MKANQFFEALFGNCLSQNKSFIEFRQFAGSTKKQEFYQSIDEAVAHLDEYKVNGYFAVCPRKGHDGTKAGVSHVVALYADVDYGKEGHKGKTKIDTYDQAITAIEQFEVKPSIIVSSGHGFQIYWLLNQPEAITDDTKLSKIENILKGIAIAVSGDGAVAEVARILRIPDTTNQKPDCDDKNVEILKLEPSLRYSLDDFSKYQCEDKAGSKSHAGVSFSVGIEKVDVETLDISQTYRELIKYGDTKGTYPSRSECDQAVIVALVSKNYGSDVIKAIFNDESNKIGEKYRQERAVKGDAYLKASIENASRYLQSKEKVEVNQFDSLPVFPLEAFPANGFLGEYIKYASQCTDAPVQYHIATALSILSIVVNRKVFINRGHKGLYPVLWVIVLGDSGTYRKTTSQNIGTDLLVDIKDDGDTDGGLKGSNEFTKESLIEQLSESPRKILCFSEIASLLTQAEASYNKGLKPILIDLFDAPAQYVRKLKEKTFTIEEPFLNILGASTTEWFIENIKEEELRSGFLARFIYICAMRKGKSMPFPPPADLKIRKTLIKILTRLNKKHSEIVLNAEAKKLYETWYVKHEAKLDKESLKGLLAPFYVRLADYLLKISMLFAVNEETLIINEAHMKQAISLTDYLTENLRYYLKNEMSFSKFTKEKKKIKKMIQDSGFEGLNYGKLLRNSNKDPNTLRVYLTTLIECGEINERLGPKNGKIYVSSQYKNALTAD